MKKIILITMLIPFALFSQDFERNAAKSIFSDYKAHRVGDAVLIIVVESSQASNQAEMNSGRQSDVGANASGTMDGAALLPSVDFGLGTNNDFKGGGKITSSGMVKTRLSALIDSVLSNGLVRIRGTRKIIVNGEEQNIAISGLVRTTDIQADNSVFSYNISDAEISLEGNGMIDRNTNPGWLTKLFHWLF